MSFAHIPDLRSLSEVLVADVLSVKLFPQELLLRHLPLDADILCTHPMFGPESGRDSWQGLPFVYDRVRIDPMREQQCKLFLDIWVNEGCKMTPMTCSRHDTYAASTQFLTHTTGKQIAAHFQKIHYNVTVSPNTRLAYRIVSVDSKPYVLHYIILRRSHAQRIGC